jgi:hypothetical protein
MAQALDNQWMLESMIKDKQKTATPISMDSDRADMVASEFRRALVNSGTLVVNRAYLFNNEGVFRHFLADNDERRDFGQLVMDRAIVPYLFMEHGPEERPGGNRFSYDERAYRSWLDLLDTGVTPSCVRFSWDDDENRREAGRINKYFAERVQSFNRLDPRQLAEDLDIPVEYAHDFAGNYLRDICRWAVDQETGGITRNAVYKEFITRGDQPHLMILRPDPYVVQAKQLVDLLYNVGVPLRAGIAMATPPQSPPRSALQELNMMAPTADPEELGVLLRGLAADTVQRAVDAPVSYGKLSLRDIANLRDKAAWHTYVDALDSFYKLDFTPGRLSAEQFAGKAGEVSRSHAGMLKEARRVSGNGGELKRDLIASIIVESPGVALQVFPSGDQRAVITGAAAALAATAGQVLVRLYIRDTRRGVTNLSQSVTLPAFRLRNMRKDWEKILRAFDNPVVQHSVDAAPSVADQQAPES